MDGTEGPLMDGTEGPLMDGTEGPLMDGTEGPVMDGTGGPKFTVPPRTRRPRTVGQMWESITKNIGDMMPSYGGLSYGPSYGPTGIALVILAASLAAIAAGVLFPTVAVSSICVACVIVVIAGALTRPPVPA